jgi:hypothetical protein
VAVKSSQVNASVVMDKEVYEKLKTYSQTNKRSVSKQILYWIEQELEAEERKSANEKK